MTKIVSALALTAILATGGCSTLSQSRVNPLNWSDNTKVLPAAARAEDILPLVDPATRIGEVETRDMIAQVTQVRIDRTAAGAIVRATGLANGSGHYNAELVETSRDGGTLTLAFRIAKPRGDSQLNTGQQPQQVSVATRLDTDDLSEVRTVRVVAAQNASTARP